MRGAFVVFEGLDKCGKSTQCEMLANSLKSQGISSKLIRFPDRSTRIGKTIHNYLSSSEDLSDEVIHLLFSANRWESAVELKRLLHQGVTVLADRYSYSGVAYSGAKPDMSVEWCKNPEIGLPKPDLVIYLQLSLEKMQERRGFGGERYENSSFQEKVESVYMTIKDETWKIIDGDKSVDDLHNELLKLVLEEIENSKSKPLSVLW